MEKVQNFGSMVRKLRKERDMSIDELCIQIGISRPHLTLIEIGTKDPALSVLRRIAKALDATLEIRLKGN